jgi:Protein of unknown function (DUF2934)
MSHKRNAERTDPVLADQGGRHTPSDPGDPAHAHPNDTVREKAYEIYERRGRKDGHAEDDWLTAELLVKAQSAA